MLLQQAALKRLGTQATGSAEPAQLPAQEQPEAPALLKHINFFEEHEARDAHPEASAATLKHPVLPDPLDILADREISEVRCSRTIFGHFLCQQIACIYTCEGHSD